MTGDINETYLKQLDLIRNDSAKKSRDDDSTPLDDKKESELIDMHNTR